MNSTQTVISDDEIAQRRIRFGKLVVVRRGMGAKTGKPLRLNLWARAVSRNGTTQQRLQSWWQRMREKIAGLE